MSRLVVEIDNINRQLERTGSEDMQIGGTHDNQCQISSLLELVPSNQCIGSFLCGRLNSHSA